MTLSSARACDIVDKVSQTRARFCLSCRFCLRSGGLVSEISEVSDFLSCSRTTLQGVFRATKFGKEV